MATITKPSTFTAGTTILSSEVNNDFDTIYADYNGNITNANIASGAAIVDTKLAQITTASKVSGAALVTLGSIPTQTNTTTATINIVNDSLTTGQLGNFTSNSSDTGTRTLFILTNDNTAATGATCMVITQDAAQNALSITHTAATGNALLITASQTTANIVDISAAALTTGKAIDLSNLDAITTGKALHIDATGITQTDGILVHLDSAGTVMTSTGRIFLSDHTGTTSVSGVMNEFASAATDETIVLRVNASAALAAGVLLDVTGSAVTTGTLIDCSDANALTTGFIANLVSNSSSTSTRTLVKIHNDHTSADDTEVLRLIQDGDDFALYVDYNATVSDTITGIRIDGCDVANGAGTVTISNVAPAGVGTATIDSWLVIDIGGTRKYIPMWT